MVNSHACGTSSTQFDFQADIVQNFTHPISSSKKCSYPFSRLLQLLYFSDFERKTVGPRKNDFSLADLGILPENRTQAAVKILNDVEIL